MRVGAIVTVCLFAGTFTAFADTTPNVPQPAQSIPAPAPRPRPSFLRQHRSFVSDIDARVIGALLAAAPDTDFDISVRTGEPELCDTHTCSVPVTVKLPDNAPPMRLAIAVSSPHGDLSDVKHADCNTGQCTVQLVLERGRNTIAVGAANALTQTGGVAIAKVDAQPAMSMAGGRTEWF